VLGFDPMIQILYELDLAHAFGCGLFAEYRGQRREPAGWW
jgi:hypothetical protein